MLDSVVDPHHVDEDPYSTCHPDADPDPVFHVKMLNFYLVERSRILIFIWKDPDADADPDPSFQMNVQKPQTLEKVLK